MAEPVVEAPTAPAPTAPAPASAPAPAPAPSSAEPPVSKTIITKAAKEAAPEDSPPPVDLTDAGDWPKDWRQKISDDAKLLKRLERYASPKDIANALISTQQKISSGELKVTSPYPTKGTTEEQTQWRKDNGIPESADKYDLKFDKGLVIGDEDKPVVDSFLAHMHAANTPPAQAKAALEWYFGTLDERANARSEADADLKKTSEDELRAEWGGEYRRNVNLIKGLIEMAPTEARGLIAGARLADGSPLGNHPQVLRWLAGLARTVNPVTTVVPGAGGDVASAIDDEITAIEKGMRTDRKSYNKDEKLQARYRELLDARSRIKK